MTTVTRLPIAMTLGWLVAVGCGGGGGSTHPDGSTGAGGSDAAGGGVGDAADTAGSAGGGATDGAVDAEGGGGPDGPAITEGGGGLDGAAGAEGTGGPDGATTSACGFVMPNPASAGLPNPASYTANQDGTITDNVTGLVWEGSPAPDLYPLDQAIAHCSDKGGGWRLPTRVELVSLVDFTIPPPGPTINAIFKDTAADIDTPNDKFWSSTPDASVGPGYAWLVHFGLGYTSSSFTEAGDAFRARCVRPPSPRCYATRYQVSGGLVHDQTTGLTWQQVFETASWSGGATLCTNLGTGWRLPSLTELQTIMDDTKFASPKIDEAAFPNVPNNVNAGPQFWTSSPSAGDAGHAWYVEFNSGFSDYHFVVDAQIRVRCVR